MKRSEKIHELLYSIFIRWFKRNRKALFGNKSYVDTDELFNKIITMEQHIIDSKNMFLKWERILERSDTDRDFELYMAKVFRNSDRKSTRLNSSHT